MAILTKGIPAATTIRARSVYFDPGGRVGHYQATLNIECDLVSVDGADVATIQQANYLTISLSGDDATAFWQGYDSDAVLEARIVTELKKRGVTAAPDVGYLPDGKVQR